MLFSCVLGLAVLPLRLHSGPRPRTIRMLEPLDLKLLRDLGRNKGPVLAVSLGMT